MKIRAKHELREGMAWWMTYPSVWVEVQDEGMSERISC